MRLCTSLIMQLVSMGEASRVIMLALSILAWLEIGSKAYKRKYERKGMDENEIEGKEVKDISLS